jgi:hypothetical protein
MGESGGGTAHARTIALATAPELPDGDGDDAPLVAALRHAGVVPRWTVWDDPSVDWAGFDLTLIRSTWDYTFRHAQFVDWAGRVPRLVNDAAVVRWNSDKRYLLDLAGLGVPIVPTVLAEPGEPVALPERGQFVVKPSVGAGSRGAARFDADDRGSPSQSAGARDHAALLQAAGLAVLVQPYLEGVDSRGETGLLFFGGQYSHAIRKASMLPPGAAHRLGPRQAPGVFEPDRITARRASPAEISTAHQVLDAAHRHLRDALGVQTPPLYARVDLLPGPHGPVLIELELIEPSLFLRYAPPESIRRLAESLAARAGASVAGA